MQEFPMALNRLMSKVIVASPLVTIEEHMRLVLKSVEELALFLNAVQDGDWERVEESQKKISELEGDADKVKQHLRRQMSSRLLMPIARSDLLNLITAQDRIANAAKDIAGLMLGRKLMFPSQLNKQLNGFSELVVQSTGAALDAIASTQTLFRSGFASQEARKVEQNIVEVERLERRTDKVQAKLRARLYKLEHDLSPVDVMFMYQVLVWMGNIADHAQTVAHKLLLTSKS
jgi:predicted phosphate transport protein (TIGR00153 family)